MVNLLKIGRGVNLSVVVGVLLGAGNPQRMLNGHNLVHPLVAHIGTSPAQEVLYYRPCDTTTLGVRKATHTLQRNRIEGSSCHGPWGGAGSRTGGGMGRGEGWGGSLTGPGPAAGGRGRGCPGPPAATRRGGGGRARWSGTPRRAPRRTPPAPPRSSRTAAAARLPGGGTGVGSAPSRPAPPPPAAEHQGCHSRNWVGDGAGQGAKGRQVRPGLLRVGTPRRAEDGRPVRHCAAHGRCLGGGGGRGGLRRGPCALQAPWIGRPSDGRGGPSNSTGTRSPFPPCPGPWSEHLGKATGVQSTGGLALLLLLLLGGGGFTQRTRESRPLRVLIRAC